MTPKVPLPPTVRLDTLIETINAVHDEPLERLIDAALAAEHLGELADHLLGHFVDQARRSGASWTEIGQSLGVTKQAARKRFVPKGLDEGLDPSEGFRRFTARARNVVVAAQEEARAAGGTATGVEHLLLGLLHEPDAIGAKALADQGVGADAVRAEVDGRLPAAAPADEVPELLPYDAGAKKALELTFREALRLGHNYVGTEHLLLALLEADEGDGALSALGVDKAGAEAFCVAALMAVVTD